MTSNENYNKTVTTLFEYQAVKYPASLALKDQFNEYTYQDLNEKANQISGYLKNQSVKSGDFVALLLEPGADFIICLIAIIKLGAIYVPLDTHAPKTRLNDLLQDAKPKALITNEFFQYHFSEIDTLRFLIKSLHLESSPYSKKNTSNTITPSAAIYMMYTSGSTGRPKGVIIPHQAIVNMACIENTMKLSSGNKMAQFSNISFDGSSFEIWTALLNGASLCIIPNDKRFNPSKFKKSLLEYDVNSLFLPTSYLHQLIKSSPRVLDSIETILFGGEQINAPLINQFLQYRRDSNRELTLINGYGPTETTAYICRQIMTTNHQYDENYLKSIGQLITNTKAYILDEALNVADEGELYVSGICMAISYHHCELQNKEKFIPNPFSNEAPYNRLYKTGDKVRLLDSGNYLYLGRYDDQVKVGGFRIHLNEIETALMNHPTIATAAVCVEIASGSHKTLTAYLVFKDNVILHSESLRDYLKQMLPLYMLPTKWLKVDKLPLTPTGKVDKAKLGKMFATDLSLHVDVSCESSIEEQIKQIWQELLNCNIIDPTKNLFDLGANSLLITDACTQINNALKTELQVGDLLAHPSIYRLSRFIEGDMDLITVKKRHKAYSSDIAIIGMSCNFPGANTLDEFWEQLCDGKESLSRFESKNQSESHYVPVRGILADIDRFDAQFFGFNATEASLSDPQQRLLLEYTWLALEHAGVAPNKMPDKIISVFSGMTDSTYLHENLLKNNLVKNEQDLLRQRIATSTSMLSTQISYRLNLKGRSINVNTACSTGLIVVDQACQDLILGYSDIAVAGAASVVVPQQQGYLYQAGSIVSSDEHCRPFSKHANGTVFSNGVGVVVLKRLNDAIRDHDIIYAVIKGCGVNNDGAAKLSFTAPSTLGQMACIRNALEEAHVNPSDISYVEAHGTATELGDIIEFDALNKAYKEQNNNERYCALGSVKANIGHTDVVAGIAGLIKATLCLYHHKIPPLINYEEPNPHLKLQNSPFFINTTLLDWDTGIKKRHAAVSSFGVGGTNAHMILSEYDNFLVSNKNSPPKKLFILSAKTKNALDDYILKMNNFLHQKKSNSLSLESIAYSLQTSKEDFAWRSFAVGSNKEEIINEFQNNAPFMFKENTHESIIFMFSGQGSQYSKMSMELYESFPEFSSLIDQGIAIANPILSVNLLEIIRADSKQINLTQYAQPALFIIEFALAKLLMSYGIKPNALIGHSLGEYVAACIAGVFSFEEGVKLICQRGLLMSLAPKGAMIAINCTIDEALDLEKSFSVELSLHNASSHCVMSGDVNSIAQLETHLQSTQTTCQKLNVEQAFHSHLMEPLKKKFLNLFDNISPKAPSINMISNVTGEWIASEEILDKTYWYNHLRQPVKFCNGLQTLLKDSHPFFIEIGAGHTLETFLKDTLSLNPVKNTPHMTHLLPSRNKKDSDTHQFLTALGHAWQLGVPINWNALYSNVSPGKVALPTYPFQKQPYWIEPDLTETTNKTPLYFPSWSRKSLLNHYEISLETIQSHSWIIFKDHSQLSETLIQILQQKNATVFIIELSDRFEEINNFYFKINPEKKEHYLECIEHFRPHLKSPYFIHLFSIENLKKTATIQSQLDLGFYSLLYLSQAVLKIMGIDYKIKGLILTGGTQKITGQEPNNPVNACIHGACAVINKEYPDFQIRSIDIDTNPNFFQKNIFFLLHYMTLDWRSYFTALALRNHVAWELNYQNLDTDIEKNKFRDSGVYLITGGVGAMALSLCEVIVAHAQNPHLILISRSPAIEEDAWQSVLENPNHEYYSQVNALNHLKKSGAIIHWHQLDILHEKSLSSLVVYYKKQLGAIHGLIHAAGIAGGGIIPLKTKQETELVLLPKVQGTYNLSKALKNTPLDFVVLMSSLVSLVGEPGQIDYAAANSALNSFATSELFQSDTVISINWNTWNDIGMATNTKNPANIHFINRGNDISSQQGKILFNEILHCGHSQIIVSNYELYNHDRVLAHYHNKISISTTKTSREMLSVTSTYTPPENKIEEQLARLWQAVLSIETIGMKDDFFTLGGHSLNALQLIDKINKHFKCSLSIQQLYKNPTIRSFSPLLITKDTTTAEIIVSLNKINEKPPYLFFCHPASGMIYCFNSLCSTLSRSFSIYGLQDPSITKGKILYDSIIDMATAYLKAIKEIQPEGPYYLIGYSFGGTLVYEIAHLLNQKNEPIALLSLIDSWSIFSEKHQDKERFVLNFKKANPNFSDILVSLAWDRMKLLLQHIPSNTQLDMVLFKAADLIDEYQSIDHPLNGWSKYNHGLIHCYSIQSNHDTILNKFNSSEIFNILNKKGYIKK